MPKDKDDRLEKLEEKIESLKKEIDNKKNSGGIEYVGDLDKGLNLDGIWLGEEEAFEKLEKLREKRDRLISLEE